MYSRSDGVVDWRSCLDPAAELVEVGASHCGMAVSAQVYRELGFALRRVRAAPAAGAWAAGRLGTQLPRAIAASIAAAGDSTTLPWPGREPRGVERAQRLRALAARSRGARSASAGQREARVDGFAVVATPPSVE